MKIDVDPTTDFPYLLPLLSSGMSGNCVPHKCQNIRLLLDDFGNRLARTVTGLSFDSNQDGICAPLCSLQCRGKLERVTWHNAVVMIAGQHQSRWIATIYFDVVERRILDQVMKAFRRVGRPKIGLPCPPDRKLLKSQHVKYANLRDRRPEQLRALGERRTDQQTAI